MSKYLDEFGVAHMWENTKKYVSNAVSSNGGSSSGGGAGEVYHQDETVIGTWIDGKPIYRQIITGVAPTDGTNVAVLDNVDWLVNSYVYASIKYSYKKYPTYFTIPISYTENTMGQVQFDKTYSKVRLYFGTKGTEYGGNPYYAILEYTKTTD